MSLVENTNGEILFAIETMLKYKREVCQMWFYLRNKEDYEWLKKELETNPNSRACYELGCAPELFPSLVLIKLYLRQPSAPIEEPPKTTTLQVGAPAETSE